MKPSRKWLPSSPTVTASCRSRCRTSSPWRGSGSAARAAGLTDVAVQGNFIKFAPAALPESKAMRLTRMYPGSQVKPALDFILIPKPKTARIGGRDLADRQILEWAQGVIDAVFTD